MLAEDNRTHQDWLYARPVHLDCALADLEDIGPEQFDAWYQKNEQWFDWADRSYPLLKRYETALPALRELEERNYKTESDPKLKLVVDNERPDPMPVVPFPIPAQAAKVEPLALTYFDDCRENAPKKHVIKGVIAKGENSTWYGAPGAMKSALKTDMAVHAAAGKDWRGYKVKEKCGVVYFAFERANLVERRLAAYAIRDGYKNLPIAVCNTLIDLVSAECVSTIIATVRAAEARFGIAVGYIIFDTWSKGIAAGGGDEDKALYQNAVAANLKRIHEQTKSNLHIAGVGHSGKDESRGERGSNARAGDVDLAVNIKGGVTKTASVVKANDMPDGELTSFAMETVRLGTDEDGAPMTTGILSAAPCRGTSARGGKLTELQQLALDALDKAVTEQGGAVAVDVWREAMYRNGTLDREATNPRADFKRLKTALVAAKRIVEQDGLVQRLAVGMPPFPTTG